MKIVEILLACLFEDAYGDTAHALLMAKSKVQNQEVFLRGLKNQISQASPKRLTSLKAKIAQEEDDLKTYKDLLKAKELEYSAAKIRSQAKKKHDQQPQASL